MSVSDSIFNNLRQKLNVFGYKQALPLGGIPLVSSLFEDLVKTTESLRDAKKEITKLLEEKSCWELGAEPYKCDNQRLLAECNQLHMQLLKQQEEFEKRVCEYNQQIRNLQSDKFHLEEQCTELQQQIQELLSKQNNNLAVMGKDVCMKSKKPFITVVRPELPPLHPLGENASNIRCTKCNTMGCTQRAHALSEAKSAASVHAKELVKLENTIQDLTEQLKLYKDQLESRDREISRLNDLLSGGRPPAALARDCCYKQVGALAQDLETLQREKSDIINQLRSYQDQMHEAMQRALKLETENRKLRIDLDEFKKAALQIEQQANSDVAKREREVEKLKMEIKKLMQEMKKGAVTSTTTTTTTQGAVVAAARKRDSSRSRERDAGNKTDNKNELAMNAAEKRRYQEQLNALTQREIELKASNLAMHKKIHKQKSKLMSMRKELKDNAEQKRSEALCDEEKIRLKSERDFFQKEYLRLVSKTGSEKEVEFLQQQIKSKDEELRVLRTELCLRQDLNLPTTPPTDRCQQQQQQHRMPTAQMSSATTTTSTTTVASATNLNHCPLQQRQHQTHFLPTNEIICESMASFAGAGAGAGGDCHNLGNANCVQAVVLRAERERDVARAEMERLRCERDALREKHVSLLQAQHEEARKVQQRFDELNERIRELEQENRAMNSARLPSETHNMLLKEEIEDVRRRYSTLQEENCMLKSSYSQLKILQEQTERSLLEYQNKLTLAEQQLESADLRLNTLDSNRETNLAETTQLRSEISALKQTYISLEHEKDLLLAQLDSKTQRACELEFELKACREKRDFLEMRVTELEQKYEKLTRESRERSNELNSITNEAKKLRHQLDALKRSRDEAIAENGGLIDNCSDIRADNQRLKKEIEEHLKENEALKNKITQYVQEIRKTEELLLRKEKEREEMLEQYRSLSQDTVALQGNNHSLEEEAAEYKRQVADYEQEICALKAEIKHRNNVIDELEAKIASLAERNISLQHCLEEAHEEKHLLKLDLTSRMELCKRLEDERTKLNAEIDELNNVLRTQAEKDTARHLVEKKQQEGTTTNTGASVTAANSADEVISRVYELELQNARLDLAEQLRMDQRLNEEVARLRQQNEHILEELEAAQHKNLHCEKLIHEYFVQNQELRHNLTDDRFREARIREQNKQQQQAQKTNSSRDCGTIYKATASATKLTSRVSISSERREVGVGAGAGDASPQRSSYKTNKISANVGDGAGAAAIASETTSKNTADTFRKHTNTPECDLINSSKHADTNSADDDDSSLIADDASLSYRSRSREKQIKSSNYPFPAKTM